MDDCTSLFVVLIHLVETISSSQRILFLESIAGVPGMVAATLRHLKSIRLMVCLSHGPVVCSAVSLWSAS